MPSTLNYPLAVILFSVASLNPASPAFAARKGIVHDPAAVNPRGQILALSCAGCHGPDGKSAGIIPSFYGKSPEYIESALNEFKSGARASTVMGRHAKGYSDEEIHLIAEYCGRAWKNTKKTGGR
jgi:sulfide dehydrogenase cytochrome subunit